MGPMLSMAAPATSTRRTGWTRHATVASAVLAAALLLASIPAMSHVAVVGGKPGPMPAPAPSNVVVSNVQP
jgi:hypothetical protein